MKPRPLVWLGCIALVAASVVPLNLIVRGVVGVRPVDEYRADYYLSDFHVTWLLVALATLPFYYVWNRRQGGVLLLVSGYFLVACFGANEAAMLVCGVLLLHLLVKVRDCLPRHIVFALWVTLFCLWLPCKLVFERMPGCPGNVWDVAPVFWVPHLQVQAWLVAAFFKRSVWFYHDVSRDSSLRWSVGDLLRYMLGLPTLIGLSATPSFAHFLTSRHEKEVESTPRSGAITCAICIGWLTVAVYFTWLLNFLRILLRHPAYFSPHLLWTALLVLGGIRLIGRLCNEQLSVGVWRLFGYNIRDDFKHPLWSPNVVEFWRRWNMLWREYLLQVFFYPVLLGLGRRYGARSAWIYFVAACVTFLGGIFFDMFPKIPFFWIDEPDEGRQVLYSFLIYHCLCGVLVGAGLFLEACARWKTRPSDAAAPPRWMRWLDYGACVGLTYLVMSLLQTAHHFAPDISWPEIIKYVAYGL